MPRKAILLNTKDNVATALTDIKQGETIQVDLDGRAVETVLLENVAMGHKYALVDLKEGDDIIKYGMFIAKATRDIKAGEWVHVHNARSPRWGFHNEKYGLKA